MSAISSPSFAAVSVPSSETPSIDLRFQVFNNHDDHALFSFTAKKTITLTGLTVKDRIRSGLDLTDNICEALPQFFACGEGTEFVLANDNANHSQNSSASSDDYAVYVNGYLYASEMAEIKMEQLRTRAFYPLNTIKQKLMILIENHLGVQQGEAQAHGELQESLNAREESLNTREEAVNTREESLNTREDSLNAREDALNAREEALNAHRTNLEKFKQELNTRAERITSDNKDQLNRIALLVSKYDNDNKALHEISRSLKEREIKVAATEAAVASAQEKLMKRAKEIDEREKILSSAQVNVEFDSEGAGASSSKRKRRKNHSGRLSEHSIKRFTEQQLEITRAEYKKILGRTKVPNRIVNDLESMKKAIEKEKRKLNEGS